MPYRVDGLGTPAPVAPTQQLVVTGPHRYVRDPMYLAVTTAVLGQWLMFGHVALVVYAAIFLAVTASFVHWYEEPALTRQFPTQYPAHRANVPGWWPRVHPWQPHE